MLNELSDHLFWDVDKTEVDLDVHRAWFLERVLSHGTMQDISIVSDWLINENE